MHLYILFYCSTHFTVLLQQEQGLLRRPFVPQTCSHNAHMYVLLQQSDQSESMYIFRYYIVLPEHWIMETVKAELSRVGIQTNTHYSPLHLSPGGRKYATLPCFLIIIDMIQRSQMNVCFRFGRVGSSCKVSERVANTLLRLPLWPQMQEQQVAMVVQALEDAMAVVKSRATTEQ